jgi:hypothetical protein
VPAWLVPIIVVAVVLIGLTLLAAAFGDLRRRDVVNERLSRGEFAAILVAVLIIALLLALGEHHFCTTTRAEVSTPEHGTPRYEWCARYADLYPWGLTFLPGLAVLVFGAFVRLRTYLTLAFALGVLVAAVFFDTHPSHLQYVHTL